MISVTYNETLKVIELYMDTNGADLLIEKLKTLKLKRQGHVHLYATNDDQGVSTNSPYQEEQVYGELILDLLPTDAWEDDLAKQRVRETN